MQTPYTPPHDPLVILHDDADVIAVDKPAGLLSVPGRGEHLADCLITRVQQVFPHALLVHRLDRDTSGVMIFGLNPHAQRTLVDAVPRTPNQEDVCRPCLGCARGKGRHRRSAIDRRLAKPPPANGLPRNRVNPLSPIGGCLRIRAKHRGSD